MHVQPKQNSVVEPKLDLPGALNAMNEMVPQAVPDLLLPQPGHKLLITVEREELEVSIPAGRGDSVLTAFVPSGTKLYVSIHHCLFARWTGLRWIFKVSISEDAEDNLFVAAGLDNTWLEVED